jgi:hypothetical protein
MFFLSWWGIFTTEHAEVTEILRHLIGYKYFLPTAGIGPLQTGWSIEDRRGENWRRRVMQFSDLLARSFKQGTPSFLENCLYYLIELGYGNAFFLALVLVIESVTLW